MDFKVKCVRDGTAIGYFTPGKIYDVKNNSVIADNSLSYESWSFKFNGNADFKAFCKWWSRWGFEFELVEEKKMFTKSNLKNGDVIIRQNGWVEIVMLDLGMLITNNEGWNDLSDVLEDLTDIDSRYGPQYDIIKVYRPREKHHCCFNENSYVKGELVYDRERDTKPLYNGKVVCIDLNGYNAAPFTVGKIYEIKDGVVPTDSGYPLFSHTLFHTFKEFSEGVKVKFLEIKE